MNWNLGLNFYSGEAILFNPRDLDIENTTNLIKQNKYHIYLVCKRKKVYFDNSKLDGDFCYTTLYYLDENHDKVYLKYKHSSELVINGVNDGYYNIDFKGNKGIEVRDFLMITNFCFLENDLIGVSEPKPLMSDLEVMYIGQAFGRTKTRTIDYRLSNHEKVQKIALDILDKGSNEEVLIIGLKVKTGDVTTSMITADTNLKVSTPKDIENLVLKSRMRLTEGQEITVFEASLINYFKPELNTEYKHNFPSDDFTSIDELYATDFNYSAVTVNTRPVAVRIFSEHIQERKYIHGQHFPLHSKSEKESLFEYLYDFSKKDS